MKKRKNNDSFSNLALDEEEKFLEKTLERDEFEKDPDFEKTKVMLKEAASRYLELHKSKPVTLRVNQLDLIKVKARAKRKQIPYQTLLGALIHEFAEDEREFRLK